MIGNIEQKIIDVISAAQFGYAFKKVESYKANFDDELATLVKNSAPAVWVAFTGDSKTLLNDKPARKATFSVIVLTRNVRNERTSRFGKVGEVGAYQIVQDITALLDGSDLGLDIKPLEYLSTTPLLNTKVSSFNSAVFEISFETVFPIITPENPVRLDDFIQLETTWEAPEITSQTNITYERSL